MNTPQKVMLSDQALREVRIDPPGLSGEPAHGNPYGRASPTATTGRLRYRAGSPDTSIGQTASDRHTWAGLRAESPSSLHPGVQVDTTFILEKIQIWSLSLAHRPSVNRTVVLDTVSLEGPYESSVIPRTYSLSRYRHNVPTFDMILSGHLIGEIKKWC